MAPTGSADGTAPQRARLALAGLILAGVVATLALGHRGFHTNDDVEMSSIVSGAYTGHPDGRLVFVQPLVSFPISWMYRFVPGVPWYGLALYATIAVALVVIGDVLLRRRSEVGGPAALVIIGCVIAVVPRMLLSVSFTATAALATMASVVLAIDVITGSGWTKHWFRSSNVVLLVVLGYSIRPQAAIAVLAVSSPVLALLARRRVRSTAAFVAGGVLVVVANRVITRVFLDAEYRAYLAYNLVRGSLHSTPRLSADALSPDVLSQIGWTSVDRGMFSYFLFDDRELFGFDAIRVIASETKVYRAPLTRAFLVDQVALAYPWLFASVLLLAVLALLGRRWSIGIVTLVQMVVAGGALAWVGLTARLPERVSLPVWTAVVVTSGVAGMIRPVRQRSRSSATWTPSSLWAFVWSVAVFVAVWSGPIGPAATSSFNVGRSEALERQLDLLAAEPDVGVFVVYGGAMTTQGVDPLAADMPLSDRRILSLGWGTFSPAFEARKDHLGVDDSLRVILRRDDVVWVAADTVTAYYEQFLRREALDGRVPVLRSVGCVPAPDMCVWRLGHEQSEV